jgi:outer membrane protein assembly factor BamB
MRREDDLTSQLPALEGPVPPDPAFAARLRDRFLAESGHRPQPQSAAVPIRTLPVATRPPRKRLLDLAAVAVLLLSMVGSLARVSTGGDPTPTIQAPTGSQDGEMIGRSAAGDGQLRGPAPDAAPYERLWAADAKTFGTPTHGAQTYGRYVFRIPGVGDEQHLGDLVAMELHTGQELWRQQVDVSVIAEVTSQGVIAGLPTGNDTFHLALLDLRTGAPIWTWWGETFASLDPPQVATLLVADGTVFFTVSDGSIYGLELISGEPRFGLGAARVPPLGIYNPLCVTPDDCVLRSNTAISMVYGNGKLYVSDLGASSVYVLSAATGEDLWSVSTVDRVGSTNISYASMIAVDEGLIVAFQDTEASDFTPVVYWGLWSAADGSEVWEGTLALGDQRMVANGNSVFVSFKDPGREGGLCCDIAEVEINTGAVTWTRGSVETHSLEGYLSDEDTLIARPIEGSKGIYGIDVGTHEVSWTLGLNVNECYLPIFPISPDGTMACLSNVGTLAAFRPGGGSQSTPATPTVAELPVSVAGSAAMDGTWPGVAPASGEYRLLWRGQAPAFGFVAPYHGKLYALISRLGESGAQGVVAYDAATGAELWYQPVSANVHFAVSGAGILVGVPDSFETSASPVADGSIWDFHVVLLDLETGQPVWRSAETYQLPGVEFPITVQIAGGAALFVNRDLTLVAIDLANGRERWRFEGIKASTPDCEVPRLQPFCLPAGPVVSGDLVYLDFPATGKLIAVSVDTGEQVWSVDDPLGPSAVGPSTGLATSRAIRLTAVEQGVLVNTWPPTGTTGTFGLWSADDGSPVWA